MTKNLVIDITTSAKDFVKGFEDALQRIEKAGANADLLSSMREDIDSLKIGLGEIQELVQGIDFDAIDTKALDARIDRMQEKFKKLRQEFANFKFTGDANAQVESLRVSIQEIQTASHEAAHELEQLFAVTKSVNTKDTTKKYTDSQLKSFTKQLNELKSIKKELEEGTDNYLNTDYDESVAALERLNQKFAELSKQRKAFEQKGISTGTERRQYNDIIIQMGLVAQSIGEVEDRLRTLHSSDSSLSISKLPFLDLNVMESSFREASKIIDQRMANLQQKLNTAEVTQFTVKNGEIQIPLKISTTLAKLSADVNSIIKELQGQIKEPIQVPITIVSDTKKSRKKELADLKGLTQLQETVNSIKDPEAQHVAQTTLDQLKKRFAQQLKIEVTTNVEDAQKEIKTTIQTIQNELKNARFIIKPEIQLTDEVKAQIKEYIESLLHTLQDIQERMAHIVPKDINGEFIEDHTMLRFQHLLDLVESLDSKIQHLDFNGANFIIDNEPFQELSSTLKNVSDNLINVTNNLSQLVNQFAPADAKMQGLLKDLKDFGALFESVGQDKLYNYIKSIDDLNGMSRSTRLSDDEYIKRILRLSEGELDEPLSKLGTKFYKQLMKETTSELELAGLVNTQTKDYAPFGYYYSGTSMPISRSGIQYLREHGKPDISHSNLSKYYDMTLHTHPISKEHFEKYGKEYYDTAFSGADLRGALTQFLIDGIKKTGVVSNGKANILDFSSLSSSQVRNIVSDYETSLKYILTKPELYDPTDKKLRRDKLSKFTNETLDNIIRQRTGLKDISHIHQQGTIEDLFKPDTSNLDEAKQKIFDIISQINQASTSSDLTQTLIDPTQLDAILKGIQEISEALNQLRQAISSIPDADIFNKLNEGLEQFYTQWKKVERVFDESDIAAQFDKIKSSFNEIADETGKYNGSKSKKQIEELMSEYQQYLNMGGTEAISSITDNKESQRKLEKKWQSYQAKLQSESQSAQQDRVDVSTEVEQLDALSKKTGEVKQAINDKTSAFENELSVVEQVIYSEVELIETLREELVAVTEVLNKIGLDFKTLSQIDFSKFKKGLDITSENESESAKKAGKQSESDKKLIEESYTKELDIIQQINKLKRENIKADQLSVATNKVKIDQLESELTAVRDTRIGTNDTWEKRIQNAIRKGQSSYDMALIKELGRLSSKTDVFETNLNDNLIVKSQIDAYNSKLQEYKKTLQEISIKSQSLDITNPKDIQEMDTLLAKAKELQHTLADPAMIKGDALEVENTRKRIDKLLSSNISSDTRKELKELKKELIDINQVDLTRVQKALDSLDKPVQSFSQHFYNKAREQLAYLLSAVSIYDFIRVGREGLQIIRDLDDALTEMAKVSDEPLSRLQEFQLESYGIAGEAATTALIIQQSTAEWMRLGETLEQAKESAKISSILFNVSEFENIDAATESLVAMSQAYDELGKMDIIDKLNNIGNNFSISTDGLAQALQRSASSLKTAGNDIDESIALITAGNAVIQDPEKVGNAMRVIALRITGTKEAKKELSD